jgi:archaellum component FlaC
MKDQELERRFAGIDARFDGVDSRFTSIDARFTNIDARFDSVDARFTGVDTRFAELRELIVREGERTRRHFDVVAEGLENRIELVAEGYSAVSSDVTDLKNGQQRLEAGQGQLDIRMLALESRVLGVEKVQRILLSEVRGLATKVDRFAPRVRPSRRR